MTDLPETPVARRVTREELYEMVWRTPMQRLAEEFGLSGNGLAKICDRLSVPYPPRGYWTKKAAGKPVIKYRLPKLKEGQPGSTDIHPTLPKPPPPPEALAATAATAEKVRDISVPDGLDDLHPRVEAWVAEHKKLQKERAQEIRMYRRDRRWAPNSLPDLTERDLYRFRVTSAIFDAVEAAGGRIEASPINGRVAFQVAGQRVDCAIVEKLVKSLKPREEGSGWTAYADYHQTNLTSSGLLRVTITTYVPGIRTQWIETPKRKISRVLTDITGSIIAAGPILERRERERQEEQRKWREEEARRAEIQRRQRIDDNRWAKFKEFAAQWEERRRLMVFMAEVESRLSVETEQVAEAEAINQWITWAKARIDGLDPLQGGVAEMFGEISSIDKWW